MSSKFRVIVSLLFLILCFDLSTGYAEERLKLPEAQRMYGFAAFVSAYRYALEDKIDEALEKLEVAIKWDPYLVEYYLLKAFCMYNLGRFDEAVTNLNFYLEVRNKDFFAKSFLEDVREKKVYVKNAITKGVPVDQVLLSNSFALWEELGVSPLDRFIPYMPGRPVCSGENLFFTDQIRGKLYIYQKDDDKEKWEKKEVFDVGKGILKAIPLGAQELALLFDTGLLKLTRWNKDKGKLEETHEVDLDLSSPSDGVSIGGGIIGVAERIEGRVSFIRAATGENIYSWSPPDVKNFKPVSLAVHGPILAVGDTSSMRVYLFDLVDRKVIREFSFEAPPRAVELFNSSEGAVLTEDGSLYIISAIKDQAELLAKKIFPEAWFLFNMEGKVYATDTRLFKGSSLKLIAKKGYLVMRAPSREGSFWKVEARVVIPFGKVELENVILQGVIEGQLAEVEVLEKTAPPESVVRIEAPLSLEDKELQLVASRASVLAIRGSALPKDTASLIRLGNFALAKGIKIFILPDNAIPEVEKVRLAEITGGGLLMDEESNMLKGGVMKLKISSASTPNVPGSRDDSGLLVLGRIGPTTVEGRIPFWSSFIQF